MYVVFAGLKPRLRRFATEYGICGAEAPAPRFATEPRKLAA